MGAGMNDGSQSGAAPDQIKAPPRHPAELHGYVPHLTVLFLSLWVTAGALSKSNLIGRLANPITHNDIGYVLDGIHRLLYVEVNGFWAEVAHLFREPIHAPLAGYQAALGFYIFGFHDWAPYATDIVYLLVFLGTGAALLRGAPNLVVIGGLAAAAAMPLAFTTVSEFAPEIPLGLFTALGVLLTLRIRMFDRATRERALAGLCFGVGFVGKPSSFVFVPIVVCATLGVVFLRDVILAGQIRNAGRAIYQCGLQLVLSLWLPALYMVPNFSDFWDYFYTALFDTENVKAFGAERSIKGHVLYFLTGPGAEYMFGDFLWAYFATVAVGMAAASRRGDRPFIARQNELLVLMLFMWLMPTLSTAKNSLFAMPSAYLLAFMVVMAIGSIYESIRGITGIIVVSSLSFLLVVSGTSRAQIPNVPGFSFDTSRTVKNSGYTGRTINDGGVAGPHVIREMLPQAMDRFSAVMLGNAPYYHGTSVYMTNIGYYAPAILQYWILRQEPTLDLKIQSLWADSNPQHHIDVIRQLKDGDFVIAGERGNGLTYGPTLIEGAAGAEDAVLAALWQDKDFAPIDQFYGPIGRTIAVFQRRADFAGWRPLAGLASQGNVKRSWVSAGAITHLQAYAPKAVAAELAIDVRGLAGQKLDVILNTDHVGQMIVDASGRASLVQPINLASGQNDILIRYAPTEQVTFERLLVVRKIERGEEGIR